MAESIERRYAMLEADFRTARARLVAALATLPEPTPAPAPAPGTDANDATLREWGADELLLRALQRGEVGEGTDDVSEARASFESFREAHPEETTVTWESLVRSGWVRVVWGRVYVHQFRSGRFHGVGPGPLEAVGGVKPSIMHEEVRIPDLKELVDQHRIRHPNTPSLGELEARGFVERRGDEFFVTFRNPLLHASGAWLFARLWDDRSSGPSDSSDRLAWWSALNEALHSPANSFGEHLDARHREEFQAAVWARLEAEPDLVGWEDERRRVAAQSCLQNGRDDLDEALALIPQLDGDSWTDRLRWLDRAENEDVFGVNEQARGRITGLFCYVLGWPRVLHHAAGAAQWGEKIASLVRERPPLLAALQVEAVGDASLHADLLLAPATAPLGLAIASDQQPFVAHTYDVQARMGRALTAYRQGWEEATECSFWAFAHATENHLDEELAALVEHLSGLARARVWHGADEWRALRQFRSARFAQVFTAWPAEGALLWCDRHLQISDALLERLGRRGYRPDAAAFTGLLALAAEPSRSVEWRRSSARKVVVAYAHSFQNTETWFYETTADEAPWLSVAGWLYDHEREAWGQLLMPTSFVNLAESIDQLDEESHAQKKFDGYRTLVAKIRYHARLLANLVAHWREARFGDEVPHALQEQLVEHVERWLVRSTSARADAVRRPGLLDAEVDVPTTLAADHAGSLIPVLGRAIGELKSDLRTRFVGHLADGIDDPRALAMLFDSINEPTVAAPIKARLEGLRPDAGVDNIGWLTEVMATVDALLAVGDAERAEAWLDKYRTPAASRRIPQWDQWIIRAELRLLLLRSQYDDIVRYQLPESLQHNGDAQRTVSFYRGVALLHMPPGHASQAVEIFERLALEVPSEPAFAGNLFAARVRALAAEIQDAALVGPTLRERIAAALLEGETLMARLSDGARSRIGPNYQANRMHLLAAVGDWRSVLAIYQTFDGPMRTDPTLGGYAVRAFHHRGDDELAKQLLGQLETRAEAARLLDPVRKELEGAASELPSPPTIDDVEDARRIREHLLELTVRPATVQAKIWGKTPQRLLPFVLADELIELCGQLPDLTRSLARPAGKEPEEDRITEILVRLARQRLHRLRWTVHFQEPGGFTNKDPGSGRGGVGELDLRITTSDDTTISVGEALRVWSSSEDDVREHFEKLFGYAHDNIPVLFLFLWSFEHDIARMRDVHQRAIANAPANFARLRSRLSDLPPPHPGGVHLLAADEHQGGHLVVHLLVDLGETARRVVAKAARTKQAAPVPTKSAQRAPRKRR